MDIATTVLNVLRTAGELAIELQPSVSVCHKEDGSVITQADLDVTELVKKSLSDFLLLPNHMLVDEESFSTLGCCSGIRILNTLGCLIRWWGTRCYANQMPFLRYTWEC